jgi:hypothetical protein
MERAVTTAATTKRSGTRNSITTALSGIPRKYFSEPQVTEVGVEVDVDAQSFMPAPMRDACRRVLVEELEAAGVQDAVVRSQYADDYETIEQPTGSWPPYADSSVPGLPPGLPPGRLLRHDLRRDGYFRVEHPLNQTSRTPGWRTPPRHLTREKTWSRLRCIACSRRRAGG